MSETGEAGERGTSGPADSGPAPDLAESLRQIGANGRAGLGAAAGAARALRSLVAADLSLARSAFGRALAFVGVAIAFGASSWLLLVATLIAFLSSLGLSWFAAMLIGAALSLAVTAYAGWQAMRYFEHTRLQATRRQLARLGIGELADLAPTPDAAGSAREADITPP
ncbi:phage holin family protein [Lysobacter cavernae]|uniref:Phage holin family protein n=1 Tax=Lysobacter cavernae TaxID=1685901 RepID=A0ABV7RP50_9GAMM